MAEGHGSSIAPVADSRGADFVGEGTATGDGEEAGKDNALLG